MTHTATPASRRTRTLAVAIVVIATAVAAATTAAALTLTPTNLSLAPASPAGAAGSTPLIGADGSVPDGVTPFDDDVAAVANLNPDLLDALRRAATDASDAGITIIVNSGWRSPEYQEQLLHDAVDTYGSEEEAARWVATAETSPHVQGDAVDVGSYDAVTWLAENGAAYGLCQIYDNEAWHFELRAAAISDGCPRKYFDPTYDPRMQ